MKRVICAALLMILAGCVRHRSQLGTHSTTHSTVGAGNWDEKNGLALTYRVDGRNGILDSDRVTLVFPDLPAGARDSFSFQQGKVFVQIGGEGTSDISVKCGNNDGQSSFQSQYAAGTNTIIFCGREVRLANLGRRVWVGENSVDLSAGKMQAIIPSARRSKISP